MDLHDNEGVLLINLGSPKELNKKSVKEYLRVFLSDDNVLDIPKFFQQLILRLFILPFRPKNTLEAYEKIWTKNGSPLIISTQSIANKLTKKTGWQVEYAMRYEEPSIEKALSNFKKKGINKILCSMLSRGCEGFNNFEFSEFIYSHGAELNQEIMEAGILISL